MTEAPPALPDDDALRRIASRWFAAMRGPDAEHQRAAFNQWLARDPRHCAAYARLEEHWRLAGALTMTPAGRARRLPARYPLLRALLRPQAGWAIAALALILAAAAILLQGARHGPAPLALAPEQLQTGIGEIRTFRLADGSHVTLDTNSVVAVAFSVEQRALTLARGRARFDVAHEPRRPFIVSAGDRRVVARGTIFDVAMNREGVGVTLLRGVVDVRAAAAPAAAAPLARLVPGESFSARQRGGGRVIATSPGSELWVRGMLSYAGAPLGQVVADAGRYSTTRIRLGDPRLAQLRVTGAFHATPARALARAIAATFALDVEQDAQGMIVLQPRRAVTAVPEAPRQ